MTKKTILIAGAGGIGQASAIILADYKALDCTIYIGDRDLSIAQNISDQINTRTSTDTCQPFQFPESGETQELLNILEQSDIILDCLPGSQAPRLAGYASKYNCHYANLTEYVKETEMVTAIANESQTGFVLQTGLAPGYINILAHHLFQKFTATHNVDQVDTIEMKVGALSKHAQSPHFYAFTWSPIGVATEYVKNALVVEDFETRTIPSLSGTETILIDGIAYEDDFTSGGAADLPVALAGKTRNLRYKTLRFPGHYQWVKKILAEAPQGMDKVEYLNKTMLDNIPAVEDDTVVVYASVRGADNHGTLRAMEKSIIVKPSEIMGFRLRAIQTTTAAPLCQAAIMLLDGKLKGPVFQSEINAHAFLNGDIVAGIYGAL